MISISVFGKETIKELRTTIWAMKNEGSSVSELYFKLLDISQSVAIPIRIIKEFDVEIKLTALEFLNSYRIVQESIQNALKYADSSQIKVVLEFNNRCLKITVIDNGKGFDIENVEMNGIENMRQRSLEIYGKLNISSSAKGTTISNLFYPIILKTN